MVVGGAAAAVAERFGDDLLESHDFRGEETIAVGAARIAEVLRFLREHPALDYDFLTDLCAVHYPDREYPYEVVYHLYSFRNNCRLRVNLFNMLRF